MRPTTPAWAPDAPVPVTWQEIADLTAIAETLIMYANKNEQRIRLEGAPACLYQYAQGTHSWATELRSRLQIIQARIARPTIEE